MRGYPHGPFYYLFPQDKQRGREKDAADKQPITATGRDKRKEGKKEGRECWRYYSRDDGYVKGKLSWKIRKYK